MTLTMGTGGVTQRPEPVERLPHRSQRAIVLIHPLLDFSIGAVEANTIRQQQGTHAAGEAIATTVPVLMR